jgi:hypothetical protein
MSCEVIQRQLKHFFEDLLTEDEYQEVCEHMTRCAQCRRYAASTGSLSYLLKELGDMEVPKDLSETIRFRLDKITEKAAADPAPFHGKTTSVSRNMMALGIVLVVFALAYFILGKDKSTSAPPRGVTEENAGNEEEAAVESMMVPPSQTQVSGKEAENLFNQLQTMATSLEKIADSKIEIKQAAKNEAVNENTTKAGLKPMAPAAGVILPETTAFHWHVPYSRDAERGQLINTVKILEITLDYEDRDFLIFKATGKQLKQLIEGVQFANKTELETPEFMPNEGLSDRIIPVSIYFIQLTSFVEETYSMPIEKKEGVFVSLEQKAPESKNIVDWHILIIPSQREKVLDAVRLAGGKMLYTSDHVAVFTILGPRVGNLMDAVSGIGGVFPDFGKAQLSENAKLRELVKVLIYFKEQ